MICVLVDWCMQAASLWRAHLQVHGQRSQLSSMNLKGLFFFLNLLTGRACFWGNTELRQVVLYYSDVFSKNFSFHREGSTVSSRKFDLNKMFGWPWSSLLLFWKDDLLQFHILKSFCDLDLPLKCIEFRLSTDDFILSVTSRSGHKCV